MKQGSLLMTCVCVPLLLNFYAGAPSQWGVISRETLTGLPCPFPNPGSEEGRVPPAPPRSQGAL